MMFGNESMLVYGPVAAVLVTLVVFAWAGITKIRRFVIHLAQFCAVLSLALSAVGGAIISFPYGPLLRGVLNAAGRPDTRELAEFVAGVLCAAIGAFVFFA